jgi:hypothetical protein
MNNITQSAGVFPNDEETNEWFEKNIGDINDCSASSAIYKFRLWLKELNPTPQKQSTDVEILKLALDKIAYPIEHLQADAEKEGYHINGQMAIQLANDANYLQGIAKKALQQLDDTSQWETPQKLSPEARQ